MKNNKGFGKFEVLTMIVILICIFGYLMYRILGEADGQKIDTMKKSALSFGQTVATNNSSFHNLDVVYLDEVIKENLMKGINSPFSSNKCDVTESKVHMVSGHPYVTLKCDNYLIDNSIVDASGDIAIYKVGKWSDKKIDGENVEVKKLYNCMENGKNIFDNYYEDFYFVSAINEKYGTQYYFLEEVRDCEVVNKDFYRTKEAVQ